MEQSRTSERPVEAAEGRPEAWPGLRPQHVEVLRARAIDPGVAARRGYRSLTHADLYDALPFAPGQRSLPALLIPIHGPAGGIAGYQLRPDVPRLAGDKPRKYEWPAGAEPRLDVPPAARPALADPAIPLWLTEGTLKADALVSAGVAAISVPGVWMFGRREALLTDWESIALPGRTVYLAFDSDAAANPQVYRAQMRCRAFLEGRGARVHILSLPAGPEGKWGIDDYLAAGGTLAALIEEASEEGEGRPRGEAAAGEYRQTARGIVRCFTTRDGPQEQRLTNFAATILADITLDDGSGETQHRYEIAVNRDGERRCLTIPAATYAAMTWVTELLGAQFVVRAGQGTRDHTRVAIQELSPHIEERRVLTSTGWFEIEGRRVYVHAGGGIDREGDVPGISVQLPEDLGRYRLPAVPCGPAAKEAVRAALALLDLAPDRLMVPLLGMVYRAPLAPTPTTSLHLYGETGRFKTAVAAIAAQHYGAQMDAEHLPLNWQSTENAIGEALFRAAHAVTVIDEYMAGDTRGRQRIQATAERVFRGVGNHSGRARLQRDLSYRSARPPRGAIISTGEDRPSGQSLAARRLDVAVGAADVDAARLAAAQERASAGTYAAAIARYLCWLAADPADLPALTAMRTAVRARIAADTAHRRTPDALAELLYGWEIFLRFAHDLGAIDAATRAALEARVWAALAELAGEHAAGQTETEPVALFFRLLAGAMESGHAHLSGMDGGPPEEANAWGWPPGLERGNGVCLGWIDGQNLYLIPEAAYGLVAGRARAMDEPFPLTQRELHRRLQEQGRLLSSDAERFTARVVIGNRRARVLHLHRTDLYPEKPVQPVHAVQMPLEPAATSRIVDRNGGPVTADESENRSTEPVQNRHASGTVDRMDRLDRFSAPTPEPVRTHACAYNEHREVWVGRDGQLICAICHPPAPGVAPVAGAL